MTVTLKAEALEAFVADIFVSAGCSKDEGGRIGRYLASANLSGHDVPATRGSVGVAIS